MSAHRTALVAAATVATALTSAPAAEAACAGAYATPKRIGITKARHATICEINRVRARHGLGAVRSDGELRAAANGHARDMARRDYFSHVSADGRTLIDRVTATGVLSLPLAAASATRLIGENLAWGRGRHAAPARIVRDWMASPTHRAALLDPRYRFVGVGIFRGAPVALRQSAATYAANFAS